MDWLFLALLAAVGLLAGALVVLIWDGRAWQTLIRTQERQRQRWQTRLNETERQLARLHRQRQKLQRELAAAKQELTAVQSAHALSQSRIPDLEAQLAGVLRQLTETQELRQKLAAAEARIQEAEPIRSQLAARLAAAQHQHKFTSKQGKKELQVIRGIGPAYAQRLGDGGISKLTDLAEQTPEQLLQILNLKAGHLNKVVEWIAEARELTDSLAAAETGESDTAVPPPQSNLS
ncbi:MAG: helix-hairpin-helix domain-containing protein [Anaerolineae bacterium]